MLTTGNYKLKKPSGTDEVRIEDLNENADIIDAELAKRASKSKATTAADGLMAAADKKKLDGIADGANKYTHPTYQTAQSEFYKVAVDVTEIISSNYVSAKSGLKLDEETYTDSRLNLKITLSAMIDTMVIYYPQNLEGIEINVS